jgi:O-antigen/teichoic acid export membrane protein
VTFNLKWFASGRLRAITWNSESDERFSGVSTRASLVRSTALNFIGLGVPLVVAFFSIPVLTRALGTDRFGILSLAWLVLGYFSLFDFGLGRAMTKVVAEKIGLGEEDGIPAPVWTSLLLMLALGLCGSVVAALITPWLVHDVLNIPQNLEAESVSAFYLLASSIPVVTTTAGLRGILEAKQRFDLVNLLRIPLGTFSFLGPLAVLPFSHSLIAVVSVLLVSRIIAWLAHLLVCFRILPSLRTRPVLELSTVIPLIRFGSWISVSNLIGPLMVTLDRFVIGSVISVTAVAYYAAPYEMITKLWIIPGALTGVLFPAFATAWVRDDEKAAWLLHQGVKYSFLLLFPLILITITFAHEGLTLWLGAEYGEHSARVLQWLAVGVFFNCFAQIPFALIQAAGRPDLTAKFHLIELPLYLAALWTLIHLAGIEGAAIAWSARCLLDTILLFLAVRRFLRTDLLPASGRFAFQGLAPLSIFGAATLPVGWVLKMLILGPVLTVFGIVGWHRVLAPEDRGRLRAVLARKTFRMESRGADLE